MVLAVLRNVQVVVVPTLQDLAVAPEKTDGVGFSILADVHHTALPFGYPQVQVHPIAFLHEERGIVCTGHFNFVIVVVPYLTDESGVVCTVLLDGGLVARRLPGRYARRGALAG